MAAGSQIALLDPSLIGDDGEDANDPRRRLMQMMSLRAMQELRGDSSNNGTGASSGAGTGSGAAQVAGDSLSTMTGDEASAAHIMPAGFDENTGLPTEYPATASKDAAASRLQKAQDTLHPPTTGGKLRRALAIGAPALIGLFAKGGTGAGQAGAAQGAAQSANTIHDRMEKERNFAAGQYEFEAGREERERDQAIREKVAMAQIEANKAYRTLMASISEQKARTGEANSEVNAEGKGLTVNKQPDGTTKVVPLSPDQLSTLNKAKLGVDQATQDLSDAKAKAIPEQIKISEDRLKIQQQMLQKALAELGLSQWRAQMGRESLDFRETGPTTTSRNMGQMARTVLPHIDRFHELITEADKKGYIGPAAGRVYAQFLAGEVGTTGNADADDLLGALLENQSLMSGALSRTHMGGRPAEKVWYKFQHDLRAGQDAAILHSRLKEMQGYMEGYSNMDRWNSVQPRAAQATQDASPTTKLKKSQPRSSTGNSMAAPPPGARIRDYTQLEGQQ